MQIAVCGISGNIHSITKCETRLVNENDSIHSLLSQMRLWRDNHLQRTACSIFLVFLLSLTMELTVCLCHDLSYTITCLQDPHESNIERKGGPTTIHRCAAIVGNVAALKLPGSLDDKENQHKSGALRAAAMHWRQHRLFEICLFRQTLFAIISQVAGAFGDVADNLFCGR